MTYILEKYKGVIFREVKVQMQVCNNAKITLETQEVIAPKSFSANLAGKCLRDPSD